MVNIKNGLNGLRYALEGYSSIFAICDVEGLKDSRFLERSMQDFQKENSCDVISFKHELLARQNARSLSEKPYVDRVINKVVVEGSNGVSKTYYSKPVFNGGGGFLDAYLKEYHVRNNTCFFRSKSASNLVYNYFLKNRVEKPVFLSVGCSTGEEVYSHALELLLAGYDDFTVLGIDRDSEVIKTAKRGVYSLESFCAGMDGLVFEPLIKKLLLSEFSGETVDLNSFFGDKVFFENCDVMSFVQEPVDGLQCTHLFEYLKPRGEELLSRKIKSLLKPEGLLVSDGGYFNVPNFIRS